MKIREYLEENGIKIKFFAEKIGITYLHLYCILNNSRELTMSLAHKIVKETGGKVTYEDLLPKTIDDKPSKIKPKRKI